MAVLSLRTGIKDIIESPDGYFVFRIPVFGILKTISSVDPSVLSLRTGLKDIIESPDGFLSLRYQFLEY
jgi:hypothetical protein